MLENYKNAFNRLTKIVPSIAKQYRTSTLHIYFDAFCAWIVYGVTPNEYVGWRFYSKSRMERKTFYTARHTRKYEKAFNDSAYYDTFWRKELFNAAFTDFIERDWLYTPDANESDIECFLKTHDKVIVKPTNLSAGRGIHIYSGESVKELKLGGVLLEDCIKQCRELSSLNDSSVNTIRVYTVVDKGQKPQILSASIRVGGVGSTTDNFHAGGVGYPIDIEHGCVCAAGADMMGSRYLYHPKSNVKVIGFDIPRWRELKEYVYRACLKYPTARLIAWDVAITETGFDMVEGNYDGDPGFMQTPLDKGMFLRIKECL